MAQGILTGAESPLGNAAGYICSALQTAALLHAGSTRDAPAGVRLTTPRDVLVALGPIAKIPDSIEAQIARKCSVFSLLSRRSRQCLWGDRCTHSGRSLSDMRYLDRLDPRMRIDFIIFWLLGGSHGNAAHGYLGDAMKGNGMNSKMALQYLLANWKTSAAGAALMLGAVADVLSYAGKGQLTPNLSADLAAIVGGIMGFAAKDANVTGGGTSNATK